MTVLRDISLFWSMFHVVALFLMLFRSKFSRKKTVILSSVGMGVLMVGNMLGLVFLGVETMGKLLLFTCSIPSFLFFYILSSDRDLSYLFTFCFADTVCLWILCLTNILDTLFGGKFIVMFVLRLLLFPLLEFLTYKYLRGFYHRLQKLIKKGWGAYACLTMLYYLLLWLLTEYPSHIEHRPEIIPTLSVVLILMVFSYIVMFLSLNRQYLLYEREKTEQLLRERNLSLEAQLENQQYVRKLKHDMRGHLITVQGLMNAGKTDKALEYLDKLTESSEEGLRSVCKNPYVNALLSHYIRRFEAEGARLTTDIRIGEEAIPYLGICSILSNGLSNMSEELRLLRQEEREASVTMQYRKDFLILRMKNRCRKTVHVRRGELPKTQKKGREHGHGLLSIRETAESLGGDMLCYTEQDCFIVDVAIRYDTQF